MLLAAAVGWPEVALALILAPPAYLSAWAARDVRRSVKTPNGEKIGEQVENAVSVSLANHFRLRSMADEFAVATPQEVRAADAVAARASRQLLSDRPDLPQAQGGARG